jgi:hypothetical protein
VQNLNGLQRWTVHWCLSVTQAVHLPLLASYHLARVICMLTALMLWSVAMWCKCLQRHDKCVCQDDKSRPNRTQRVWQQAPNVFSYLPASYVGKSCCMKLVRQ